MVRKNRMVSSILCVTLHPSYKVLTHPDVTNGIAVTEH